MPVGGNPNLIALVGTVQQKSALAAYNRQITKLSSGVGVNKSGAVALATTDKTNQDTATISRPAITALENAQTISDESIIRSDDFPSDALGYSREQILEHSQEALTAQSNQVSERLRDLYRL
jgi:hypothetical protein